MNNNTWTETQQLVELSSFYEKAKTHPEITDEEFVKNIRKAFWATNCWSFVEASFAIIAPGCLMRPHLTKELIKHPIDAMIAGGLESSDEIIAQGIACATKEDHYVEPTEDGKYWLLNEWPKQEVIVKEVFQTLWDEITEDDEP